RRVWQAGLWRGNGGTGGDENAEEQRHRRDQSGQAGHDFLSLSFRAPDPLHRTDTDGMSGRSESKRRQPRGVPGAEPAVTPAPLAPGLYLVATPIGNAADITLRALDVLARADALACEDTRRTRQLMEMHGLSAGGRPVVSYHDRNGAARRPQIVGWLEQGMSVAYASDAGTPLISDPGYRLVEAARAGGHGVHAVPGASAVLAALSVSG